MAKIHFSMTLFSRKLPLLDQQKRAGYRGDYEEGWRLALELKKLEPDNKRAVYNRGWFHMDRGEVKEAFKCMEAGRGKEVDFIWGAHTPPSSNKPEWTPDVDLNGKTILVDTERGYGDMIVHLRFVRDLKEKYPDSTIMLIADNSIGPVLSTTDGCDGWYPRNRDGYPAHDYWAFGSKLPYSLEIDSIRNDAYLSIKRSYTDGKTKPRVGIRWLSHPGCWERVFAPSLMFNACRPHIDKFDFFSLQRDCGMEFLPDFCTDLSTKLTNWSETAQWINGMDVVISSCTSIVHLAAAMGKKTYAVVPLICWFPYGMKDTYSKWYPDCRVFRQKKLWHWEEPFKEINEELGKL